MQKKILTVGVRGKKLVQVKYLEQKLRLIVTPSPHHKGHDEHVNILSDLLHTDKYVQSCLPVNVQFVILQHLNKYRISL